MRRFALCLAVISLVVAPSLARAEGQKHHLGFAIGYAKHLSDDLKDEASGIDFTDAGYGAIAYRLSVKPNLDVTLDLRGTTHSDNIAGIDFTGTTGFFGPGIRVIAPSGGMRPYVQANFFLANETIEAEQNGIKVSADENGAGFGISGGLDIRASHLLSVPIEVTYMYAKPEDDISCVGVNVGLTFNFGEMH